MERVFFSRVTSPLDWIEDERSVATVVDLGDARDEPDTGKPPCDFCRREVPCECAGSDCMCDCGRCMAPPLPIYRP
jgi:hypothetical protein